MIIGEWEGWIQDCYIRLKQKMLFRDGIAKHNKNTNQENNSLVG